MKSKYKPVDWLRAIVLERMKTNDLDAKSLAILTGFKYDYIRKLLSQSPTEWPQSAKKKVFRALEIDIASLPKDVQCAIAQY